jgi:hypothetical protein
MENVFIDNPIILSVLNVDTFSKSTDDGGTRRKKIKQQVVWINTRDKKVVNMWDSRDINKLKKHYGPSISNILDNTIKIGGDDQEEELMDLDEITFDDDDIDDLLKDVGDVDNVKTSGIVIVEKPFVVVKKIYVFPEDKVSEFKKKIYISTGIPPYRQHLWYEVGGKSYPMSYTITHDTRLNVDINDLYKQSNLYEGIHVDTRWYAIKDEIKVTAMDEFQLLDHIYYKYGITEYFVVDLNDFINPVRGNLERLIKKDMYSIELIYYSFIMKYWPQISLTIFGEYVKNEETLMEKYPDLAPSINSVKNMYKYETEIVGSNYIPEIDGKKWDVPLHVSITYSVISVSAQYILPGSIVYLRNLFDIYALNNSVNYMVCNIEVNGRPVLLTKSYKATKIPSARIAVNAILLNIQIPDQGHVSLIINKNGNYKIESRWREDQSLNFNMIYAQVEEYVKPVIEKINSFGKMVSTNPLTVIRSDNSVFTDINISMFWKFNMSKAKFQNVKDILDKYVNAGIITKSVSGLSISHDYYFTKGMYKYDMGRYISMNPTQNQYQYLTDSVVKSRHDTLITKRKRLSITHRFSDIKIEFSGLKEQEYVTFYIYILRLLESIPRIAGERISTSVKKLKQLKEKDPSLYEFNKIYDTKFLYSKLCQQQKQPVIYNEPGKNRVTFWNFTTNEPAYYGCPNPKYPHINFITHAHPKNYCIPCCYKLQPSTNINDKKRNVYNTCMEHKKYDSVKKSLVKSRYVMSYGKDVEVGRLSKLPENTLEPLFYDTFSTTTEGIDDECEQDKGYYLFGVPQNIKNVSNVGFLFSISHALGKNIIDFVSMTIDKIINKKESWSVLMGGKISQYFNTITLLTEECRDVFIGDKMGFFEHWNELFIDIAKIYWDISVVHFIDNTEKKVDGDIALKIPGYVLYMEDYVSTNKHIIVIERDDTFYPVYVIYKDTFFKIGTIETKMYNHTDTVILSVYNLASHHVNRKHRKNVIDIYIIKKFTQNYKYNIATKFINSSNFCYGVALKYIPDKIVKPYYDIKKSDKIRNLNDENYEDLISIFNKQTAKSKEKEFFIPLYDSYYKKDGTHISFSPPSEKISPTFKTLSLFVEKLNIFMLKYSDSEINDPHSKQTIYPSITVENWLLFSPVDTRLKKKVIGFRCMACNYLIQPIGENEAIRIHDVKMIKMLYSPHDVNTALYKNHPPVHDGRYKKIPLSLYHNYLYPIMIIELINVMDKQRNTTIRKKIETIVKNYNASNNQNKELFELLRKYPDDYKTIKKLIINNLTMSKNKKVNTTISEFVSKKMFNKTELLSIIDNSVFDFDKKMFEKMKTMTHKDLVKELCSIFSKITVDAEPKFDDEFPNMIMSCEINHPYCRNKKLMIKKNKLDDILDIMAADILNPSKAKYIFSTIFVKNTIDYFKFIIRAYEHITITI